MNRRVAALFALVVLVAALGISPAIAQEEKPLRFGVKLGMNISDFRGNEVEGLGELIDWKAGFCGGFFMSYAVNDWFTVQPELLYSMKGMKIGMFGFSALTFSLDYIEVPVLAMAKLPLKSRLKPFVYAGPVIGFNVRSNMSVGLFDDEYEVDLTEYVNTTEFSLAFGGGINVVVAGRELILEVRYVPGLTNILDEKVEETGESIEWKNDTISILAGLAF